MRSKTSWFNREILTQSFRSVGWVSIIYLVGLLLTLPMQVLIDWSYRQEQLELNMPNDVSMIYYFDNLFRVAFPVQFVLLVFIPILLGVFLFRFLQVKQASDFMHALPLKRTHLYTQYLLIGYLFLVGPVLITALVLGLLHGFLDLDSFYSFGGLLEWVGYSILVLAVMYTGCVMIAMITGLSAVHGVLTYIMFLFPAGILGLSYINARYYFYGFDESYYFNMELQNYSPIITAAMLGSEEFPKTHIWIFILLTVLFVGLGLLFYQYRKLERVSQPLVFNSLRPVFKYGVTACVMLLGGVYFSEIQYERNFTWLLVGYAIGSLIGYLVAEMVLHKTWRVFNRLKGYVYYVIVAGLVIAALQFDVTGFERRVPDLEKIESVYVGDMSYSYAQLNADQPDYIGGAMLTDQDNIEKVRELHKHLIEQKSGFERYDNYDHIYLAYELENGDQLVRKYTVQLNNEMIQAMKPVYESMEYKQKSNEILHVNPQDVIQIRIHQNDGYQSKVQIKDPELIVKAIEALKNDVKNAPYEGRQNFYYAVPDIEIFLGDENVVNLSFRSTYTNFKEVLEEAGLLEDLQRSAEEVRYAVVVPGEGVPALHHLSVEEITDLENGMMIEDTEKIKKVLDSSISYDPGSPYVVMYKYSNGQIDFRTLDETALPDFIKEHYE